jgi:hypothetical protein
MMPFAYPNVDREDFIGCGQFLWLSDEQEPPSGYEEAAPRALRLAESAAVATYCMSEGRERPGSPESPGRLYEAAEIPRAKIRGDSLDLAYCLALITRTRRLRWAGRATEGDVWATGVLNLLSDGSPVLLDVTQAGFTPKVQAFLAREDPSAPLFLFPKVNLTLSPPRWPAHFDVRRLSLWDFRCLCQDSSPAVWARKTVLAIDTTELPPVVAALFETPLRLRSDVQARADTRIDAARDKVREWGARLAAGQWDWHCLGHALQSVSEGLQVAPHYQRGWNLLADLCCRVSQDPFAQTCLDVSFRLAATPTRPGSFYTDVQRTLRTALASNSINGVTRQPRPEWFDLKYQCYWTFSVQELLTQAYNSYTLLLHGPSGAPRR